MELIGRLRGGVFGINRIALCNEAADEIERLTNNADNLRQQVKDLTKENAILKTVMVAAAEEIRAHWSAHCDAEGYGPANLMRRLEEGIPSEYGYTAGAFERLTKERDALRLDAELLAWVLEHPETAAEELGDAAAGEGEARHNLEKRRASIAEMMERYKNKCDAAMKEKPCSD